MPNNPVSNQQTDINHAASADSNRGRLLIRNELSYCENPAPGNRHYQDLRFTSETGKVNKKTEKSSEINSNRGHSDSLLVGLDSLGEIRGEFSPNTYDSLLEAFMGGIWGGGTLRNGLRKRSFAVEKGFLDVSRFFLFGGMTVDTFSLSIEAEKIVNCSFGFMGGKFHGVFNSTVDFAPTARTSTPVITAAVNVAGISINGFPRSNISSLKIEGKNNLRAKPFIGQVYSDQYGLGDFDISVTMTGYFGGTDLYAAFLQNAPTVLTFNLLGIMNEPDQGPTQYQFVLPYLKLPDSTVEIPGRNADIMETITFEALYELEADNADLETPEIMRITKVIAV